jgi:uncharacterized membrane protein
MNIRLLFAFIYIIVDLIYVFTSKSVYDNVVINIQGSPIPTGVSRIFSALAAWTCMAIGWYYLTTSYVQTLIMTGLSPFRAGAFAGFINGLVVIGTFNFTVRAMFTNYSAKIMIRDLCWGVGWVTLLTIIYSLVNSRTSMTNV